MNHAAHYSAASRSTRSSWVRVSQAQLLPRGPRFGAVAELFLSREHRCSMSRHSGRTTLLAASREMRA